jgi:aromatic-L-amino-acid decarboxylase
MLPTHKKELIEEFRRRTHELVDFVADYWLSLEDTPVKSSVKADYLKTELGESAPDEAQSWELVMNQLSNSIMKGVNNWQHPMFMAYFPSLSSFPALQGEFLAKAINNPSFSWDCSPVHTELEILVADWMAKLMGLPSGYLHSSGKGGGLTHGTASECMLVAMVAARSRVDFAKGVLYISDQTHACVKKNCKILDIKHVRYIPTIWSDKQQNYIMDASALSSAISSDKEAGLEPMIIICTIGTTNTTGIDPISEIGEIATRENVWLHVDSAYAGVSAMCDEFKFILEGLEYADSFNVNASKWFGAGMNSSFLYTKDLMNFQRVLTLSAEYIRKNPEDGIDLKEFQLPLGRDFRALKIWLILMQYGANGIREMIRKHVRLAGLLEAMIQQDSRLELIVKPRFGLVCFKVKEGNEATEGLIRVLESRKDIFLKGSEYKGMKFVRVVISSEFVEESHIHRTFDIIQESLNSIQLAS